MEAAKKFLFETAFDADAGLCSRGGANRGAVYSEEDLAAAREEALAEGRNAGFQDAQASIENRVAQTLTHIREQLAVADHALAVTIDGIKRDAIEVARTVMSKALPGLARREGLGEIEALVADCLEKALSEPRLVVRVHDSMLDALKAHIDSLAERSGYERKIVLMADDSLGEADCRVEWADGGAERNIEHLWGEIDASIERYLASLNAPALAQAGLAPAAPQAAAGNATAAPAGGDGGVPASGASGGSAKGEAPPDAAGEMRTPAAGAIPAAAAQSSTDAPPDPASPGTATDAVTTD